MKEIYTITMIEKININEFGYFEFGDRITTGFFNTKEEAVLNTMRDLSNCDMSLSYKYCIVECINEGLFSQHYINDRVLFKFNNNSKRYEPFQIKNFQLANAFSKVYGFAMG